VTDLAVWHHPLQGDIWLVGARGRLDHGLVPQLEATINQLLADGRTHLIVDLSQANYVNSGGLRVLVAAWRTLRRQGGDLTLCGLNRRVGEIFETMGFHRIFRIYPTPADAASAMVESVDE
jgi:anti-sigma B factor antagonist